MDDCAICENIRSCREALLNIGRADVEICAVTKTVPAEAANLAYDSGILRVGENRVQEILLKFPALNPGFSVDLIGQLQTNKVKYIMECVSRVQSLDRMSLALELNRRAIEHNRAMPCLIQVNIARETQKSGLFEEALLPFIREAARLPGIKIEGLMAIMPQDNDPEAIRPFFRRMRVWFDRLRDEAIENVSMDCLSMGMSADYLVAAQEGSTLVRLGGAIFGKRTNTK